jgi:hypothetical protein
MYAAGIRFPPAGRVPYCPGYFAFAIQKPLTDLPARGKTMKKISRAVRMVKQLETSRRIRAAVKVLACGLSICVILALTACQQAEVKPLDITESDICFRCKSPVADKHYAAELVTKDGFVRKFDDMGCMLEHAKTKIGKKNIVAYYVMDFPTQQWVKAEEAQFVKSDKFQTPQNGGILAFKDKAKAEALAAQYQAQPIKLEDLLK